MVAPIDKTPFVAKGGIAPEKPVGAAPEARPAAAKDGLSLSKAASEAPPYPTVGHSIAIAGGKINATGTVLIDADPERVMAAIEGDWSKWWPQSSREDVPKDVALPPPVANEKRFQFREGLAKGKPAAVYVVQQFEPKGENAGKPNELMMVVPYKMQGAFTGDGRYEIRVTPAGKTLLTSKWEAVTPTAGEAAARAHLVREEAAFHNLESWLNKDHP